MPELPEVDALAGFLSGRLAGEVIADIELASIAVLKTFDPPLAAFRGMELTGARRLGKFLDVSAAGAPSALHLVVHFARAGWLRWSATARSPSACAWPVAPAST